MADRLCPIVPLPLRELKQRAQCLYLLTALPPACELAGYAKVRRNANSM